MIRRRYILTSVFSIVMMTMTVSALAVDITVPNYSFENYTGSVGTAVDFANWTEPGGHAVRLSNGFVATDGTHVLTLRTGGGVPNGVQSYASVLQTLSEAIDTSSIYTLSVDVGRWANGSSSPLGLELYWNNAGTPTRIAATAAHAGSDGNKTYNLQVAGTELAGLAGQSLGIRLFTTRETGNADMAYDNVRLTKETAPTPSGNPTNITVPDFSFEQSGSDFNSWTANPVVWGGGGWPRSGNADGQNPTNGADKAYNTAYQLMPTTFIEGATYTLTVDVSSRGDQALTQFDVGSAMLFRQDQNPGGPTTAFSGPTIAILDGALSNLSNPPGVNGALDWTTLTFNYVATAADDGQQIGIMVTTASGYQAAYDNVRLTVDLAQEVEAVPEPGTWALAMIGLAGLGVVGWRKRRVRN